MAPVTPYRDLIRSTAADHDLDADLFEALVWAESRGQADAFRFEPAYATKYKIAEHPIYKQWPVRAVAASYGLTQIMVPTAYELGWRNPTPEYLFHPDLNLHWGAVYLAACFRWANEFDAPESARLISALSAYNGGRNSANSPLRTSPKTQAYALRILDLARQG